MTITPDDVGGILVDDTDERWRVTSWKKIQGPPTETYLHAIPLDGKGGSGLGQNFRADGSPINASGPRLVRKLG